jgi:hypothetical protein
MDNRNKLCCSIFGDDVNQRNETVEVVGITLMLRDGRVTIRQSSPFTKMLKDEMGMWPLGTILTVMT